MSKSVDIRSATTDHAEGQYDVSGGPRWWSPALGGDVRGIPRRIGRDSREYSEERPGEDWELVEPAELGDKEYS